MRKRPLNGQRLFWVCDVLRQRRRQRSTSPDSTFQRMARWDAWFGDPAGFPGAHSGESVQVAGVWQAVRRQFMWLTGGSDRIWGRRPAGRGGEWLTGSVVQGLGGGFGERNCGETGVDVGGGGGAVAGAGCQVE